MTRYVRPREAVAVRHPESTAMVVPDPREAYSADDLLVKAYPWLFTSDDEAAEQSPVEQATAAPGERRTTKRR